MLQWKLRDLFWLALVCACGTLWVAGHRAASRTIERQEASSRSFLFPVKVMQEPRAEILDRSKAVRDFARLPDESLEEFLRMPPKEMNDASIDPCLDEMARRGMTSQLAKFRTFIHPDQWYGRDVEVLTALRRAERLPDPLKIHLEFEPIAGEDVTGSTFQILAMLENVDAKRETVTYMNGGDDRSGRHDRWLVTLRDRNGGHVVSANFWSFDRGGVSTNQTLTPGERSRAHRLDIRDYVSPPQSGEYTMQVFYHNRLFISDERNLRGLIVSQSEPIQVYVDNPADAHVALAHEQPIIAMFVAVAMFVGTWIVRYSLFAPVRGSNGRGNSRDVLWCGMVVAVTLAWSMDQRRQTERLEELKYHPEQHWTIRRLDSP